VINLAYVCNFRVKIAPLGTPVIERQKSYEGVLAAGVGEDRGFFVEKDSSSSFIIPTYNRGSAVLSVLEKIQACEPQPAGMLVSICRTGQLSANSFRKLESASM
jgi:hypothetical protein